jgi:hypothetical protein
MRVGIPEKVSGYSYFETIDNIWDIKPQEIQDFVMEHVDIQKELGTTYLLLPTLRLDSFNSGTAMVDNQIKSLSINYIQESLPERQEEFLLTLCINESAFSVDSEFEAYLQRLTLFSVKGFYIVIESTSPNSNLTNASILSKVMYMIDTLKRLDYEIYFGYTDVIGLLYTVSGVTGFANGFYKNLKVFQNERFTRNGGGGPIPPRIFLPELLASVRIQPDYQQLQDAGLLEVVLDEVPTEEEITTIESKQKKQVHDYWKKMRMLETNLTGLETQDERISELRKLISNAKNNYGIIKAEDIPLEKEVNGNYLPEWERAITLFENDI